MFSVLIAEKQGLRSSNRVAMFRSSPLLFCNQPKKSLVFSILSGFVMGACFCKSVSQGN